MLSHSLICMALYKYMKHVSLLFCSRDAQVKIKSPMIIVRATALPSSWAKKDWIAGNTENNTEYTNWQQVPCCHTYVFFLCFLMMCFLSISVVLHERAHDNTSCWTLIPSFHGLCKERKKWCDLWENRTN